MPPSKLGLHLASGPMLMRSTPASRNPASRYRADRGFQPLSEPSPSHSAYLSQDRDGRRSSALPGHQQTSQRQSRAAPLACGSDHLPNFASLRWREARFCRRLGKCARILEPLYLPTSLRGLQIHIAFRYGSGVASLTQAVRAAGLGQSRPPGPIRLMGPSLARPQVGPGCRTDCRQIRPSRLPQHTPLTSSCFSSTRKRQDATFSR